MKKTSLLVIALVISSLLMPLYGQINFEVKTLENINVNNPTTLDFGPDGKLYVAQQNGEIFLYDIIRNSSGSYEAISTDSILLVKDIPNHQDDGTTVDLGSRQITGLVVTGTAQNPIIYVGSSDPRIGGGSSTGDVNLDTNSGIISRLTWNGSSWGKVDLIRGLPRSEENHANNGMVYDAETHELFSTVGGMTNAGSPSNNFAFITEYAYAASIVRIDLSALEAMPINGQDTDHPYVYDLPTVDDPTRSNVNGVTDINAAGYIGDINDPFGGNDGLNQAKLTIDSPVQIYSAGYRNAYDITITEQGNVYTWDNGANRGWGGLPANEGGGTVTNNWIEGEPGSNLNDDLDEDTQVVNNMDGLHFIGSKNDANRTYYGGHPVPIRANPNSAGLFTHTSGSGLDGTFRSAITGDPNTSLPTDWPPVPSSLSDSREGDFQNPGVDDGSIYVISKSTNGLEEYRSSAFSGQLVGDLIVATWNGILLRVDLNSSGELGSNGVTTLASGLGSIPLDVTTQDDHEIFPGTIWTAMYGSNNIKILEPTDAVICNGGDSFSVDDDNDGYSNADEIDAGTDPCNPSQLPSDADLDFISDVNDDDDDNDGIKDNEDLFPLDSQNGLATNIPVNYELLNGDPGFGFFGLGFTGIMHDGVSDYLDLYTDEENSNIEIIAGGAVGLLTYNPVPTGTPWENHNSAKNVFQFGISTNINQSEFSITSEILSPDLNDSYGTIGYFFGDGTQKNYFAFGFGKDGIRFYQEVDDAVITQNTFPIDNYTDLAQAKLSLLINPSTGTVTPSAELEGGAVEFLSEPIELHSNLKSVIQDADQPLAIGLLSEKAHTTAFSATWDSLKVNYNNCNGNGKWVTLDEDGNSFQARHESGYVKVGEKFYLLGGRGNRSLDIYDPVTSTWTTGTSGTSDIHHFQPVVINGEIWIAGAFTGSYPNETPLDNILIYNPENDTWRDGPSMPTNRKRGSCGVVYKDDLLYLVCGITDGHTGGNVAWLDSYNLTTQTWTILPDAPHKRDHFQSVLINNGIWNTAGRRTVTGNVFGDLVSEVDYYDIPSSSWKTLNSSNDIPTPRAAGAALNYYGKVIVIGGETSTQAHTEVEALDPATETWETLPGLNQQRHGTGVVEYNGVLYIASGSGNKGGGPELSDHEQYVPNFEGGVTAQLPNISVISNTHIAAVESGNQADIIIQLQNTGNAELFINNLNVNGEGFELSSTLNTLNVGETADITVIFNPDEGDNKVFQGDLVIQSNDPDEPTINIALTGERSAVAITVPPTPAELPSVGQFIVLEGYSNATDNYSYLNKNAGDTHLKCDTEDVNEATVFLVEDAGNGELAFSSNSLYLCSENGTEDMNVNRENLDIWEAFLVQDAGNGFISIKGNNNAYVSSTGSSVNITCNASSINTSEKFKWAVYDGTPEIPDPTAPIVSFISPASSNVSVETGYTLPIEVDAVDPDGSISNVRLYVDGTFIRQENYYSYEWKDDIEGLGVGTYEVTAVATDKDGNTGEATFNLTVTLPPPVNQIPQVSFISPSTDVSMQPGYTLPIEVDAVDPDGSISNVRLYVNGTFIRQENYYSYDWKNDIEGLEPGVYEVKAIATDDLGNTGEATFTLTVQTEAPEDLLPSIGQFIILEGYSNAADQYSYLNKNDTDTKLICDTEDISKATIFEVKDAGNGALAFLSNGFYLCSENGWGDMNIDRTKLLSWETFQVQDAGDGFISLIGNNGKYVSSSAGSNITCNANSVYASEKFKWSVVQN